jgi:hypothetical protein
MLCTTALLFAVGCLQSFLVPGAGCKQVVPGPAASVAANLESGLSEAGIQVLSKSYPDEIRLAGKTKSGKVFCLYVRRPKTKDAQSEVTIYWDHGEEPGFWQTVVGILTAPVRDEIDDRGAP